MSERLVNLLESVLGQSKKTSGTNRAFYCPKCNHYKRKLEIDVNTTKGENRFACWVCGFKGRTIHSLLKQLQKDSEELLTKLNNILGVDVRDFKKLYADKQHYEDTTLKLPSEFVPLYMGGNTPEYRQALHYVTKTRGISLQQILKYNIGYCEEGLYKGMLIFPSYDKNNDLNFFTGRSFWDENWKHKNPDVSKDIIGYENQINWKLPITLTESAIDAITIRRNTIPLFGKLVLDNLKWKILEENVKEIYVVLDPDAIKKAIETVEYFMGNGITVYLVDLGEEDPNELGYDKVNDLIKNTEPCTFSTLTRYKLSLI